MASLALLFGVAYGGSLAVNIFQKHFSNVNPPLTENPKLQFEIIAKLSGRNGFAPVEDGDSLSSLVDEYVIVVRPITSGFLYIYQVDSSGKTEWLFPTNSSSKYSAGANPVLPKQVIHLPASGENHVLFLDKTPGEEKIYAVLSATRWPKLEEALASSQLPNWTKTFQETNAVITRGIGGTRVDNSLADVENAFLVQHVYEGKTNLVRIVAPAVESSNAVLTVERWFHHLP